MILCYLNLLTVFWWVLLEQKKIVEKLYLKLIYFNKKKLKLKLNIEKCEISFAWESITNYLSFKIEMYKNKTKSVEKKDHWKS